MEGVIEVERDEAPALFPGRRVQQRQGRRWPGHGDGGRRVDGGDLQPLLAGDVAGGKDGRRRLGACAQRRHAALASHRLLLAAARHDEPAGSLEVQQACDMGTGHLTHGMAKHQGGANALRGQRRDQANLHGKKQRLGMLGFG